MRFLSRPTLLLAVLAALVVSGCGDDGGGSGQPTAKLLSDTFGTDKPIDSGRLALAVDVNADGIAGLPSPLKIALGGPFQGVRDRAAPKFDFDLGLTTRDGSVTIGAISTGEKSWLTLGGRAFTLQNSAFDGLVDSKGDAGTPRGVDLSSFGVDPRRWLRDVRDLGVEDLRGERVIHLRGDVDAEPLIGDLDKLIGRTSGVGGGATGASRGITDEQRQQLAEAVTGADVDIWTGEKDHKLRRISVNVKLETPAQKSGRIRLDLAVSQLNRPQAIGPPANPRPISELTAALAALGARGAGGAAGGTPGDQTSPGGGDDVKLPEGASQYDRCLAGAGSDLSAAQRCAGLVGK